MFIPKSIDHLVFRVADLATTQRLYSAILGEPTHRTENSLMYMAGSTRVFFTVADPATVPFNKEQIGLNHLALGVTTLSDLETIQAQLTEAGITHSGIKLDQYGLKEFIWLDDPDGLRIEFYLRPD